jgi:hypothetical protein
LFPPSPSSISNCNANLGELARVEAEPLLPAEKWLIGGSLLLGAALLGVLLWVIRTYFPVGK